MAYTAQEQLRGARSSVRTRTHTAEDEAGCSSRNEMRVCTCHQRVSLSLGTHLYATVAVDGWMDGQGYRAQWVGHCV